MLGTWMAKRSAPAAEHTWTHSRCPPRSAWLDNRRIKEMGAVRVGLPSHSHTVVHTCKRRNGNSLLPLSHLITHREEGRVATVSRGMDIGPSLKQQPRRLCTSSLTCKKEWSGAVACGSIHVSVGLEERLCGVGAWMEAPKRHAMDRHRPPHTASPTRQPVATWPELQRGPV